MSDREAALKSNAFRKLKEAFENKEASVRSWLKCGKKAVLMLGDEVPEEVILAADMLPVRLSGYYGERKNAEKYLERSFGPFWCGVFEALMNGSIKDIADYLVLSNSSDMILKIYYYLNEIKRLEPDVCLPELKYLDFSLTFKAYRSQELNLKLIEEFIGTVEKWSGKKITDQDLKKACELTNEYKQALREFSALRYGEGSRVLGSEALAVIGGSQFMDIAEATALIKNVTEDAKSWPLVDSARIFYTGSVQETLDAYELTEEAGLNIISEDHVYGDRFFDRDINTNISPKRGIMERYTFRFPSSERSSVDERAIAVPEKAAEVGAKGLLVFMNYNDESYIWDFPRQKIKLDELGIPSLVIEKQRYPLQGKDTLAQNLKSFAGTVKGGN